MIYKVIQTIIMVYKSYVFTLQIPVVVYKSLVGFI